MKPKLKKKSLAKVKKELWVIFSQYIRMSDGLLTTGSTEWALCITCGKRYHFKLLQAGHFVAGRHSSNLFSERGVHAQCYNCNINLKGNTLEYRRQIIKLYGKDADLELENEAKEIKKYTIPELEEMITTYKQKIEKLRGENKIKEVEDVPKHLPDAPGLKIKPLNDESNSNLPKQKKEEIK